MSVELFVLLIGAANLLIVLELLRRRKLSEHFVLLWVVIALAGVVLALGRPLVDELSSFLGIQYGTSLLFTAAIGFLIAMCLYLSITISKLEHRIERLAERVTILGGARRAESHDAAAGEVVPGDTVPDDTEP